MSEPKISVIIPIYNVEKYISRLLESLLSQSYLNFELILLNDGSTDNTLNELKKFDDNRIILVDKKNTGVSDTRNKGLELVTGDLLTFVDSDDFVSENYFQTIVDIYNQNNKPDLINFGFYSEVENDNFEIVSSDTINYSSVLYSNREEIKNDFVSLWDHTMLYNIWNKVYKVDIVKNNDIKFVKANWGEDVIFNRDYLNIINTFYNSEKCFYHYIRERKGALTKNFKKNLFEIRKQEFFEYNEYFERWNIDKNLYYEFSCRRFVERVLGCFENIYCSGISFKEKYKNFKIMILDKDVREALKFARFKSVKVKILVLPIRFKLVLLETFLISLVHFIKVSNPEVFNKMKNRR